MSEGDGQENRLIAERRAKLVRLREAGNAYPNDFRRDSLAAELLATYGAQSAETLAAASVPAHVAGRLMVKRVMGGSSFVKLQDRSGQIQLMLRRDRLTEPVYSEFKKWDLGDIVAARGELIKTKTGELSIDVAEIRLLAKSLRPLPEKWHGITDIELKLRQRYLDLIMSEETREVFRRRSALSRFIRAFLGRPITPVRNSQAHSMASRLK
jgi:lysyl-tRNA synthetase class 2